MAVRPLVVLCYNLSAPQKGLRAVIAAREPMAIDQVLPDPHRIAPNNQAAFGRMRGAGGLTRLTDRS